MKIIALIPARLASTRFPQKLLKKLGDQSVIATTYLNTIDTHLFDEVAVVTDSDEIAEEIALQKGKVYRSTKNYECGTDRIAEFAYLFEEEDIIINVQGDEPFVNKQLLSTLIEFLKNNTHISVATLKHKLEEKDADNPNFVKLVTDREGKVLIFSRAKIPYHRNKSEEVKYFRHIGIYAFRQSALLKFSNLPMSTIEKIEQQEAMRFLENDIDIYVLETNEITIGIDTEDDWRKANEIIKKP